MATVSQSTSLLSTKLYIPPPRSNVVVRARLIEKLNQGLREGRPLTLISAPAGSGKTTLLSTWLSRPGAHKAAWLSLDELDNDPARFWLYVIAALQTIQPNLGLIAEGESTQAIARRLILAPGTVKAHVASIYRKLDVHSRTQALATASSALKDYSDWPGLEQVFSYTCDSTNKRTGEVTHKVTYGVTSLTAREAGPERLLRIVRGHWGIESGCHYRRDVTLQEDNGQLELGHLAQVMACLNNLVLGLTIGRGQPSLPEGQRHYDAHPDEALALILLC